MEIPINLKCCIFLVSGSLTRLLECLTWISISVTWIKIDGTLLPTLKPEYQVLPVLFPWLPLSFLLSSFGAAVWESLTTFWIQLPTNHLRYTFFWCVFCFVFWDSNSNCPVEYWTNFSAFASLVLALETCALTSSLYSAGDWAQSFMQASQVLLPLDSAGFPWYPVLSLPPLSSILT